MESGENGLRGTEFVVRLDCFCSPLHVYFNPPADDPVDRFPRHLHDACVARCPSFRHHDASTLPGYTITSLVNAVPSIMILPKEYESIFMAFPFPRAE